MFQSSFNESSCDELELPGKKLNDVIEFLRCIYPNTFTQMTRDSALKVLPLLEEYQVLQHKPRCEAVLLESVNTETDIEELCHLLQETCLYNLDKLHQKCVSLASEKSQEELDETLEKFVLPAKAAKEIFEKINKKLREQITNLEVLLEEVSEEAKKSKEKMKLTNAELMKELALMKQYLSADVKKTKELKLDGELNWQGKMFVLFIDMDKTPIQSKQKIVVWDIPLTVSISISKRSGDEWLKIEIINDGIEILCSFKMHLAFVNRQPNGQNQVLYFNETLPNCVFGRKARMYLKPKSEVMDVKNGLVFDGEIGIIVQMYMSQPNTI
ncbi:uncharacterized protein LOC128551088 [Mercenaria mercenaria]|uniref:uncharacterized protein LOC128551088 n=1 Tax=Mercenaria mercenaria TaxID=6596 RepID=UPI00234FA158|nr:uncharacterized protein LOC128551088 [Mercenaria mercenaria]